jgi:hypothetical protein
VTATKTKKPILTAGELAKLAGSLPPDAPVYAEAMCLMPHPENTFGCVLAYPAIRKGHELRTRKRVTPSCDALLLIHDGLDDGQVEPAKKEFRQGDKVRLYTAAHRRSWFDGFVTLTGDDDGPWVAVRFTDRIIGGQQRLAPDPRTQLFPPEALELLKRDSDN